MKKTILLCLFGYTCLADVLPPNPSTPAQVTAGTSKNTYISPWALAQAAVSGGGAAVSNQVIAAVVANFYTNNTPHYLQGDARLGASTAGLLQCSVTNANNSLFFQYQYESFSVAATSNTLHFVVPPRGWYKFIGVTTTATDGSQALTYYATNGSVVYASLSGVTRQVIAFGTSNYMSGTNIIYNTEPTVPFMLNGNFDLSGSGNTFNANASLFSGTLASSRIGIQNYPNVAINSTDGSINGLGNVLIATRFSTNNSAHGGGIIGGKYNTILGADGDTGGESDGILFSEHSSFDGDNSQSVMLGGIWNLVGNGDGGGGLVTIIGSSNRLTQAAPAAIIAIGFGLRTTNSPTGGTDAGNSYSGQVIEMGISDTKRIRFEGNNLNVYGLSLSSAGAIGGSQIVGSTSVSSPLFVDSDRGAGRELAMWNGTSLSSLTTYSLDADDDFLIGDGQGLTVGNATPASASAAGTAGTFRYDASFLYICIAPNTWKRVAISTW